jgi:PAS domain S-box-containing protein
MRRQTAPADSRDTPEGDTGIQRHRPLRVLLIAGHKDDAHLFAEELTRRGLEPAFSLVESLEEVKAALDKQEWDCIISDYSSSRSGGLAALSEVQSKGKDIPFIFISETPGEDIAVKAMKYGAHDYIMRNRLHRLAPAVERELREAGVRREQRRMNDDLKEIEQRFRKSFEYAPIGMALVALDGRWLQVNSALCSILGYAEKELLGLTFQNITHPDDLQADLTYLQQLISGRIQSYHMEKRYTHKQGHCIWVQLSVSLIRDPQEKPSHFFSQIQDITARKDAEAELRLMAHSVASVQDCISITDLENRFLFVNDAFRTTYGYTAEELLGKDVSIVRSPHTSTAEADQILQGTGAGGWHGEIVNRRKDGSDFPLELWTSVVKDETGIPVAMVGVARNITDRKMAEDTHRRSEEQFLRAQRMESIGTLAGGIAHDLNNILAPIMMAIEILRNKVPDPRGQKLLNTIETSATRGADIVKQVLAFGRGVKGDRVLVQLKHVVREVIKIVEGTFPKSIEIKTDIPRDLWTALADPTQMHQVLLNVLVNARDAMPRGGTLTISAENVRLDENYARMHADAKPGEYVSIAVSDTGTGISEDIREKIFEPFFTTKEIGTGTGLGLSTTLAIVKSHDGFISLYSEVGKGSTFRIYIPATGTASHVPVPGGEPDLPTGNGELILVIDDEAAIREITRETLEAYGYKAVTASDGAEGVAAFAAGKKEIKVVITDIMMPVMDGTAAILALMKINPEVKIIAASGLTARGQVDAPPDPHVQAFLTKPYTAEKLLKVLAKTLGAGKEKG